MPLSHSMPTYNSSRKTPAHKKAALFSAASGIATNAINETIS